jgi:cytoplasmic iron level regulating protein YaaA (DUF328/UPF0246 family)
MICVISPAKRLNQKAVPAAVSAPQFSKEADELVKIAGALSVQELCALMDISPALGALNHDRFANFGNEGSFAAAFLFDGDTYAGLEARSLSPDALHWANGHLRILSGLYGLLRPLDGIAPYRLEMGSRLKNPRGANLYAFWGTKIAQALNDTAQGAKALVNCASTEYFSAVDQNALNLPVITPQFLETEDGAGRIISFWAKRARGAMARYICEHHITDPDDLRGFDLGGYRYDKRLSNAGQMVFTRPYQPQKANRAA